MVPAHYPPAFKVIEQKKWGSVAYCVSTVYSFIHHQIVQVITTPPIFAIKQNLAGCELADRRFFFSNTTDQYVQFQTIY
jgi:hypothetical protein